MFFPILFKAFFTLWIVGNFGMYCLSLHILEIVPRLKPAAFSRSICLISFRSIHFPNLLRFFPNPNMMQPSLRNPSFFHHSRPKCHFLNSGQKSDNMDNPSDIGIYHESYKSSDKSTCKCSPNKSNTSSNVVYIAF